MWTGREEVQNAPASMIPISAKDVIMKQVRDQTGMKIDISRHDLLALPTVAPTVLLSTPLERLLLF